MSFSKVENATVELGTMGKADATRRGASRAAFASQEAEKLALAKQESDRMQAVLFNLGGPFSAAVLRDSPVPSKKADESRCAIM